MFNTSRSFKFLYLLYLTVIVVACYMYAYGLLLTAHFNKAIAVCVLDVIFSFFYYYLYKKHKCIEKRRIKLNFLDVLGFILFVFLIWVFSQVIGYKIVSIDPSYRQYSSFLNDADSVLLLLLTVVIAPIFEEILIRGYLFNKLYPASRLLAYAGSTAVFIIMHGTFAHIIVALPVALISCYLYETTGSLIPSICLHSFYNLLGHFFRFFGIDLLVTYYYCFIPLYILGLCVILLFICKKKTYHLKF